MPLNEILVSSDDSKEIAGMIKATLGYYIELNYKHSSSEPLPLQLQAKTVVQEQPDLVAEDKQIIMDITDKFNIPENLFDDKEKCGKYVKIWDDSVHNIGKEEAYRLVNEECKLLLWPKSYLEQAAIFSKGKEKQK